MFFVFWLRAFIYKLFFKLTAEHATWNLIWLKHGSVLSAGLKTGIWYCFWIPFKTVKKQNRYQERKKSITVFKIEIEISKTKYRYSKPKTKLKKKQIPLSESKNEIGKINTDIWNQKWKRKKEIPIIKTKNNLKLIYHI
jgi:hypothetical protein